MKANRCLETEIVSVLHFDPKHEHECLRIFDPHPQKNIYIYLSIYQ